MSNLVHLKNKGRIGILFWEGYLGVAPSLINGIRMLERDGYSVDVITRANRGEYAPPPNFSQYVKIITCPSLNLSNDRLTWAVRPLELLFFIFLALKYTVSQKYVSFIGVDMFGLITATVLGLIKQTAVLYWSLEIYFLSDRKNPVYKLIKKLEQWCNRKAIVTLIQDRDRATSLITENRIRPDQVLIVPNAPLGAARIARSDFFHKKFSLPDDQKVVLHIGMIEEAVLSLELASSAAHCSHEYVLVFHTRARTSNTDAYINKVATASDNVLLSLDPVPYDELDELVSSGYVGLVLYDEALGPNFSLIAGASGKLAQYLRCGLPIICNDLPSLREVVQSYQCGVCVSSLSDLPAALTEVNRQYDLMRGNAVKCYEERYEFGAHFERVLSLLRQIELNRYGIRSQTNE